MKPTESSAAQRPFEGSVEDLLSQLIQFDTQNPGGSERKAAEWIAERLHHIGLEPQILEAAPGRTSVVVRVAGANAHLSPLLVHTHIDTVPADPSEWSRHPLSGEIADGYVWGRGAVDMKHMIAMLLQLLNIWAVEARTPERDLVLAFMADEEQASVNGSQFLVARHPELFDGCTQAIGEVGGFSVTLNDQARLYMLQTAEKGLNWIKLRAIGRPGHGSMLQDENAVAALARSLTALESAPPKFVYSDEAIDLVRVLSEVLGIELNVEKPELWLPYLGNAARMIGASIQDTINPTMLHAGYKENVVPGSAEAMLDVRFLPGHEAEVQAHIRRVVGSDIEMEVVERDDSVVATLDQSMFQHMERALKSEDPGGRLVPYIMSGATDAKAFSRLGIDSYGFTPLRLPPDLDFTGLFHGIDERIPVESLEFGVRVLDNLLGHVERPGLNERAKVA